MRPTERFGRALSQYFKHTNITSFVRQLNIYGFQKVVAARGPRGAADAADAADAQPEEPRIWQFRHAAGLFRRGHPDALQHIKRRSSRTAKRAPAQGDDADSDADDPDLAPSTPAPAPAAAPAAPLAHDLLGFLDLVSHYMHTSASFTQTLLREWPSSNRDTLIEQHLRQQEYFDQEMYNIKTSIMTKLQLQSLDSTQPSEYSTDTLPVVLKLPHTKSPLQRPLERSTSASAIIAKRTQHPKLTKASNSFSGTSYFERRRSATNTDLQKKITAGNVFEQQPRDLPAKATSRRNMSVFVDPLAPLPMRQYTDRVTTPLKKMSTNPQWQQTPPYSSSGTQILLAANPEQPNIPQTQRNSLSSLLNSDESGPVYQQQTLPRVNEMLKDEIHNDHKVKKPRY